MRSGDVVSVGQPIGTAGSTGWTDDVGLRLPVQETPTWNEWGGGGWFETDSLPVSFSDPDLRAQRANGVPRTDDVVISGNPGPGFEPFRHWPRPAAVPASVPFAGGVEREISAAYEADSPDGYGLHFAAPEGVVTEVRPLFGGELAFAGCATGASASLGRTVAISLDVDGTTYLGDPRPPLRHRAGALDADPQPTSAHHRPDRGHRAATAASGRGEPGSVVECPGADPRGRISS